jgi:hypothetical protein
MQASSGATLNTTKLDQVLQDAYNNSVSNQAVGMYTFGRVPNWASSVPGDSSCAYQSSGGTGQCDPPAFLNADGSGSDADWRAFITALATHLNSLGSGYAPVKYFEVWNEIDRSTSLRTNNCNTVSDPNNCSYNGSDAQLLRLLEDMKCILTGTGTIHNYPNAYPTVPYSTACSSTGWSTSATQISGAMFLSPSSHAQGTSGAVANSTGVVQNFLYCSDSSIPRPDCNWNSSTGYWGSAAVDIINFHMKPGNEAQTGTNTDPETEMATEYGNATGILDPTDLAKPFWDGEAGYSGNGWDPNGGDVNLSGEYVQQAAFTARYMLGMWSLGIQNFDWYAWDISNFLETGGTTTDAGIAYSTVASWMIGSTMTSSCANVTGFTNPAGTQTLWSCTLTQNSWTGEVFWDTNSTAYNCDSGTCTTYGYNVLVHNPNWHYYQTPIGIPTKINSPYTIQVSNLPVIIMTNAVP